MARADIFYLFLTVLFLCLALFTALAPYEWLCQILRAYGRVAACPLRPAIVTLLALGFFLLALLASKRLALQQVFSWRLITD